MAMRMSLGVVVSAGALLAATGFAGAGVAGSPDTSHNLIPKPKKFAGWQITSDTAPANIDFDDASSPWTMTLVGKNGAPLGNVKEGKAYFFQQVITLDGNEDWEGWMTSVLTPGWEWLVGHNRKADPSFTAVDDPNDQQSPAPIAGLQRIVLPGDAGKGGSLNFAFDPLSAGEDGEQSFVLRGYLRFVGVDPSKRNEKFRGGSVVLESEPNVTQIPAPGAVGLLAMVGLAAGLRRRSSSEQSGANGLD